MNLIIQRYFAKEILLATLAVLGILLFIGLSNQFVDYLADAAKGEIAPALVFQVVAMHLPSLLGLLLPLGLFLGILLAFSRLYADSEMTALFACGLPYRTLLKAVLWPAALVTGLALFFNLYLAPHYLFEVSRVLANAQSDLIARAVIPGRFQTSDDGKYVLYIDDLSSDKVAHEVFIAEQEPGDSGFALGVIASKTAVQWQDEASQDEYIVLKDGNRYQGQPGQGRYQIMSFKEYGLKILQRQANIRVKERAMPTLELWNSPKRGEQAEFQWRLCISLSTLVLAGLAVVLSKVKPRQGKYAKAFPAILVAIVYVNLLMFAKGYYKDTHLPEWIGLYWVVVLGFILGGAGLWWQSKKIKSIPWVG